MRGGRARQLRSGSAPADQNRLRSRLEDDRVPLVAGDDAVKLSEVLRLVYGYAQLLHLKGPGVIDNVAIHDGLGVITGEAEVGVDGWRQIIHDIAGRYRDFKGVCVARRLLEF